MYHTPVFAIDFEIERVLFSCLVPAQVNPCWWELPLVPWPTYRSSHPLLSILLTAWNFLVTVLISLHLCLQCGVAYTCVKISISRQIFFASTLRTRSSIINSVVISRHLAFIYYNLHSSITLSQWALTDLVGIFAFYYVISSFFKLLMFWESDSEQVILRGFLFNSFLWHCWLFRMYCWHQKPQAFLSAHL